MNSIAKFRLGYANLGCIMLCRALAGCSQSGGSSESLAPEIAHQALTPSTPQVDCTALTVSGTATSTSGATWTYTSTDGGVSFRLSGTVFAPTGSGPFPAVVVNHGTGTTPKVGDALSFQKSVRSWGAVAIATFYTHSKPDTVNGSQTGLSHLPNCDPLCPVTNPPQPCSTKCYGASPANLARAHKTRDILSCLGMKIGAAVDLTRVATHGHSRGSYVTAEVVGAFPNDFKAASHTAGGVATAGTNPDSTASTNDSVAQQIIAPYSIHHSPNDNTVLPIEDQRLDAILTAHGVAHELRTDYLYGAADESDEPPDNDHTGIAADPNMVLRVKSWYQANGVIP